MKKNMNNKSILKKYIVIMILLVASILFFNQTFAKEDKTNKSPINENEAIRLSYPSVFSLLSNQTDGDYVYIRYEDLLSYPTLMCSAKGTALPGYASTVVKSGGKSTDTTDQGQNTGTLTQSNRNSATVFKTGSPWTASTSNPYEATTSKTYGRFKIDSVKQATPAEAWVLSEMNMNDPKINSITFELTDQEYTGEVNDNNKIVTASNDELWSVEWDDSTLEPTKYVTKKDNKYYYVTTDSYAPYTYVQHAWWKVKTVGTQNKSGVKDTDLAYEAEAFEDYIKKIAVDGENWKYNSDNTIQVDYQNYISKDGNKRKLGFDSSKVDVRFNADTNKYVVGPFSVNYLRAGVKEGAREKVSFSGISSSTLIGVDADGNELLDSDGNSLLKLGENYRFVYDHDHNTYIPTVTVHNNGKTENVKLDTEEDYPYPYEDEEFYIEIDYLDNLAELKNFKFDFQYMNAGASFEYLKGTYLIIYWSPWYNSRLASSNSPSSTARVNSTIELGAALSSRDDGNVGGASNSLKINAKEEINLDDNSFEDKTTGSDKKYFDFSKTEKNIEVAATVPAYRESEFEIDVSSVTTQSYGYYRKPKSAKLIVSSESGFDQTYDVGISNGKISKNDIPREYKAPVEYLKFKLQVTYEAYMKIYDMNGNVISDGRNESADSTQTYTATFEYENDIVEEIQLEESDYTYLNGDTIYLRKLGVSSGLSANVKVKLKEDEIKNGEIEWYVNGNKYTGKKTELFIDRPQDGEYVVTVSVRSQPTQDIIQQFSFKIKYEKMYLTKQKGKEITGKQSESFKFTNESSEQKVYIYNAYQYVGSSSIDNLPDNQNPVITEGDDSDLEGGCVTYRTSPDNVELTKTTGILFWKRTDVTPTDYLTQNLVYNYYDACGGEVSVNCSGTIYNTVAFKEKLQNEWEAYGKDANDLTEAEIDDRIRIAKNYGAADETIKELENIREKIVAKNQSQEEQQKQENTKKEKAEKVLEDKRKEYDDNEKKKDEVTKRKKEAEDKKNNAKDDKTKEEAEKEVEEAQSIIGSIDESQKALEEEMDSAQREVDRLSRVSTERNGGNSDNSTNDSVASLASGGGLNVGLQSRGARYYQYYLRYTNESENVAQDQINGRDATKVDIDADNGLGQCPDGTPVEIEFLTEPINLRTRLSGMVWIDNDDQKDQSIGTLGVKDSGEKYADDNSVEIVVWKVKYQKAGDKLTEVERTKAIAWDEEGKKIDFINNRIYIKDGKYSIPEIQVPAEEGLDTSKYVMSYDVEFVYDGQTYEATEYLKSSGKDSVSDKLAEFKKTAEETKGEDSDYSKIKGTSAKTDYSLDSYIVENADERKDFDSYFTEFYGSDSTSGNPGNSPINEDGTTNGKATGGAGQSQYNYVEKGEKANKTADLQYTSTDVGTNEADTKKASTLVTHDDKGFVYDQYKFAARTSEGGLVFPYETKYHVEKEYYDNLTFQKNAYKPVDEYFNQINLGLLERYHTDISVLKDLYKAKVVVDEQETDYTYNSLGALTEDSINKTVLAGYREKTYNIGLYNADYKYRSSVYNTVTDPITKTVLKAIKDETELRLFVTYKVQIYNGSEYTDVSINEFKDYYDDSLTMVTDTIKGYISTSNQSEQARQEQVLAEKPYARKLSKLPDGEEYNISELYKWNKTDDLNKDNQYIDKFESDNTKPAVFGENDDNDLKFEKIESGKDGYSAARCTGLSALSSDKKSVNGDLMLEPGEVYEIYITYEVDQKGFGDIQSAKATDPNNPEAGKDVERKALLDDKKNIFEVSRYTSAYTQEGVNRHKTTSYKAGQISGRVDRDSAPDNVNMSLTNADDKSKINSKYFEDDTEAAPVVHVGLKGVDEQRILNGVVWEDSRKNNKEANGKYDENVDEGIKDIDVTMVEKINVTVDDLARIQEYIKNNQTLLTDEQKDQFKALEKLDYEFEYVWPDNTFEGYSSKTVSGNDGKYEFKNFVAGNYVVRFEYGNKSETLKYNGQDYRNTAYQTGMTNAKALTQKDDEKKIYNGTTDGLGVEAGKVSTLNNQWHDLSNNEQANEMNNARVSDARDYEPRRLMVDAYSRTITNKNAEVLAAYTDKDDTNLTNEYKAKLAENNAELIANTSMVANTAKFVVDIEKQSEIKYEENSDNTEGADASGKEVKHEYVIGNIDFGLVKRAETRIYTQKEISKIELLKNDGKEVVLSVSCDDEGNIIKTGGSADENKTVRVDKITEINKETLAAGTQGFKYVAVEASYLKGLQVKLTYKITVTNKSEDDYTTQYIANIKDARELYKTAEKYQSGEIGVLNEENNYSPFNTGKGIIYGQYVGLHYYTNSTEATEDKDLTEEYKFAYNGQNTDVKVKTTIDQIVDYIDNDISISKEDTESIANQTWVESSAKDREEKLSSMSYIDNKYGDENLVDNKGRQYVGTGKNNIVLTENENMTAEPETITYQKSKLIDNEEPATELLPSGEIAPQLEDKTVVMYTTINDSVVSGTVSKFNTEFTKELAPEDKTSISIVTTAQASEEAIKNMNYDNLMEIVMYSNPVGRRDTTAIPGNANMIAKQAAAYEAGYDRRYETKVTDEEKEKLPAEAKDVVEDENGDKTYYFLSKSVVIDDSKSETGKKEITTERDAYAAKDTVTFSEPTGLSLERQKANMAIRIILLSLIIAAVGIMIATVVVVFRKTKYDDTDLLSDDRK